MNTYRNNLTALRRAFPGFESTIENRYSPPGELDVLPTPTGYPTAKLNGKYLHSPRDPMREARRAVQEEEMSRSRLCVFLGFGLGYHLQAYLEENEERTAVLVEKEPGLFLEALQHRDMSQLFSSGRITLLLDTPPRSVPPILSQSGQSRISVFDITGRSGRCRDYYSRVRETVIDHRSRGEVNISTLSRFGKLWVRNLAHNLPLMPRAEDAGKLQGLFTGMPVLVVAAGPSLDELLPLLPHLAKRMPVIAVDTSLRALRRAGIDPDILTVVDPQYWNTRHLDRLDLRSTVLVSESSTHPLVFRRPLGRIFFGGSIFPLGQFLETKHGTRFKLGAGGSVATTAWDVARILGASEVYMAGLDLGFPNSRTHYSGSYFEERLHRHSTRLYPHETAIFSYLQGGAPFRAPNNSGGTTLTDKRLVVYTKWFEEQLSYPAAPPTYNLSLRGIAIDGMEACPAEHLLDQPLRRETIAARVAALPRDTEELIALRSKELSERVTQLIEGLERISRLARKGEHHTRRLIRLTEHEGRSDERAGKERAALVAELEQIDKELSASGEKEVAGFLLKGFVEALPNSADAGAEEWLSLSEQLYRQLAEAADYHIALFRSTTP